MALWYLQLKEQVLELEIVLCIVLFQKREHRQACGLERSEKIDMF